MTQPTTNRIRELIDRLARISSSERWSDDLNPVQKVALAYLARANRFSRAPSQVADYLNTTRGTATQTLKALDRKGFIEACRSETDRRSLSYSLTEKGTQVISTGSNMDQTADQLSAGEARDLEAKLENILHLTLAANGGHTFGICRTCKHHRKLGDQLSCDLLGVQLTQEDSLAICHEHANDPRFHHPFGTFHGIP